MSESAWQLLMIILAPVRAVFELRREGKDEL